MPTGDKMYSKALRTDDGTTMEAEQQQKQHSRKCNREKQNANGTQLSAAMETGLAGFAAQTDLASFKTDIANFSA